MKAISRVQAINALINGETVFILETGEGLQLGCKLSKRAARRMLSLFGGNKRHTFAIMP